MKKLSSAQQAALNKLSKTKYQSADDLGVSITTLDCLVKKGKALKKHDGRHFVHPRTCILYIGV
jgi:hypothetical protein